METCGPRGQGLERAQAPGIAPGSPGQRPGAGLSCYACDGPARNPTGIRRSSAARSRVELRVLGGRGRIRTCVRASPPAGLKARCLGPLGHPSSGPDGSCSRLSVVKSDVPRLLGHGSVFGWARKESNPHLEVPGLGCCRYTTDPRPFRASRFADRTAMPPPWWSPHHRAPRIAAFRFSRTQRAKRRIPAVRLLRNRLTSFAPSREGSGPSESNAHPEDYGLGCCRYTTPRQLPAENTSASAQ